MSFINADLAICARQTCSVTHESARLDKFSRRVVAGTVATLGNPAGRLRGSRNRLSEEVVCALLRDFRKHGEKAIARVREENPGMYLKVIAMVIPRQHKVEHRNPLSSLGDEELAAMVAYLEERIAQRVAGDQAKLIEGDTVGTTAFQVDTKALPVPVKAPDDEGPL